jgi:aryl-alcohol dehydrogenase-like predicted oxidoreductase
MQMRDVGSLSVSILALGTNDFGHGTDADTARALVDRALALGINLFDTADVYGEGESERMLGRAAQGRRQSMIICSKFGYAHPPGMGGGNPLWMRQSIERTLSKLGTDYLDVYYLHRPDPLTPIAETLGALNELVKEGKVREIGCSQSSADLLFDARAAAAGGARFVCVENEYNMLVRDAEASLIPACRELDIALLPYFPLASGLLTGKYSRDTPPASGSRFGRENKHFELLVDRLFTPRNFDLITRLGAYAVARDHTLAELALAWLAAQDVVSSVIAGATRAEQLTQNAAAINWTLTDDERGEIVELLRPSNPDRLADGHARTTRPR